MFDPFGIRRRSPSSSDDRADVRVPLDPDSHPDSGTVIPSLPASPTCLKFDGVAGSRRMTPADVRVPRDFRPSPGLGHGSSRAYRLRRPGCWPTLAWRESLCQAIRGKSLPGQGKVSLCQTFSSHFRGHVRFLWQRLRSGVFLFGPVQPVSTRKPLQ